MHTIHTSEKMFFTNTSPLANLEEDQPTSQGNRNNSPNTCHNPFSVSHYKEVKEFHKDLNYFSTVSPLLIHSNRKCSRSVYCVCTPRLLEQGSRGTASVRNLSHVWWNQYQLADRTDLSLAKAEPINHSSSTSEITWLKRRKSYCIGAMAGRREKWEYVRETV